MDEGPFLSRAIALGAETMRAGRGGPFGAVVVEAGIVIGEGANRVIETCDPTAHAEVLAIRAACARKGTFSLTGTTIYASSEPCPMCLAAIYWARIDSIVFSSGRKDAARAGFDDAVFYEELHRAPLERRVPMRQMQLPESPRLFDEWLAKPDRTPY
jgi:tRNA(Arg) A34 adenosine deaminase TadA